MRVLEHSHLGEKMKKDKIYYEIGHEIKIILNKDENGVYTINKKASLKRFKNELDTTIKDMINILTINKK